VILGGARLAVLADVGNRLADILAELLLRDHAVFSVCPVSLDGGRRSWSHDSF